MIWRSDMDRRMAVHPRPRLLNWKPQHRNTLIGFAKVQFSSGLIISEIAVHRSGDHCWAQPPARPWIENDDLVRDVKGKVRYQPLISFATHGVQSSWSKQVIEAVRDVHPNLLPGDPVLDL